MCFHTDREVKWFLARMRTHSAIILRDRRGNLKASWLVEPLNDDEIPKIIAALRAWHPGEKQSIDLSLVNEYRLERGLAVLNEAGLPIYSGFVPARAEDTPIGHIIKDLWSEFRREREVA